jgi:hypothetical protein
VTGLMRRRPAADMSLMSAAHGLDIAYRASVSLVDLVMNHRSVQTCCCCPTARETSRVAIGLTALALQL